MELRKTWILRLEGADTEAVVVRDGAGRVWVETPSGDRIEDAIVMDNGRTVSVRRGGRMYLVDLTPRDDVPGAALVNGRGGAVEMLDELGAAAAEQSGASSSQPELRAQMPGLVVDVKVKAGDKVTTGQPAIVLEAMKMQNELGAPGEGVVEEVLVSAGQSVDSGAVLLRLAAEADTAAADVGS
jgi:3-methylcrotonyl-CoA carboxylase alpha subunit